MWEKLKATGKPILLYGMGDGAEKIAAELKKREIPIARALPGGRNLWAAR